MTLSKFIKFIRSINTDAMTAEQIRYVRVDILKLTQQEMADELGISKASIGKYEYGTRKVPTHIAISILNILELRKYMLVD